MVPQEVEVPVRNAKDEDDSHVVLIQNVLDRAMRKDCIINEVFLQLIKQEHSQNRWIDR